jgi:hypothetical protein
MASSGAKVGKNTRFLRETGEGSGVYVIVAEVQSINGPKMIRDAVEATNLSSDDDHGEHVPGVADGGDVDLMLNHRPDHASHGSGGLSADFQSGTVRNWRIEWPQFPNTPSMTFRGFLTGYEVTAATKTLLTASAKFKVTGKPTLANFA